MDHLNYTGIPSPIISLPHHSERFVTVSTTASTSHCHPKPIVYIRFTPGVLQPTSFDKYLMMYICHCAITQKSSTAPQFSVFHQSIPPSSQPLVTTDLSIVFIVCLFVFSSYHIVGII